MSGEQHDASRSGIEFKSDSGPLVSVLIPVFNRAPFVAEAITSVQAQTIRDLEILVHDDGSTDATMRIIADLARRDARIKVERTTSNRGVAAARNRLIERAGGRYIGFVDSDDRIAPTKLERQIAYLMSHPECVALGSGCTYVAVDGQREIARVSYSRRSSLLRYVPDFCCASLLYRADALRAAMPFRAAFVTGEDIDLVLRVAEQGQVTNIAEPLYVYRQHPDQISRLSPSGHAVAIASRLYRSAGLPDPVTDATSASRVLAGVLADRHCLLRALDANKSAESRDARLALAFILAHAARRSAERSAMPAVAAFALGRMPGASMRLLSFWLRQRLRSAAGGPWWRAQNAVTKAKAVTLPARETSRA